MTCKDKAEALILQVEYVLPEMSELVTCQRLGVVISNHLIGRAPFDNDFLGLDLILDKVISDIDVFGASSGTKYAILFKENSTPVVLVYDGSRMMVSLFIEKMVYPNYMGYTVINRY